MQPHQIVIQIAAWLIALAWLTRTAGALRGIPAIPNLLLPAYDLTPAGSPTITVIVPARNEQTDIAATLTSLLAQDYPNLRIIAIDDRSTDATGLILQQLAAAHPTRLQAVTITELPPRWLGKPHAMATAATLAIADHNPGWLLFTDADILFRSDAIRRALAAATSLRADHLVLFPTAIIRRWDEAALLAFFQFIGIYATRFWRPPARNRHAIGVGAFNLITAPAYRRIGGFEVLRMEIVEDIALGRRVVASGFTQRAVFGKGLVRVHWAAGLRGLIHVMTKNIFAVFHFNVPLLLAANASLLLFCALPFATVFVRGLGLPSAIAILSIATGYCLIAPRSGISAWNAILAPFAAIVLAYAEARSMVVTLRQRGVLWRGTFYPLSDLRKR